LKEEVLPRRISYCQVVVLFVVRLCEQPKPHRSGLLRSAWLSSLTQHPKLAKDQPAPVVSDTLGQEMSFCDWHCQQTLERL
jgi:hypothetical protein